VKIEDDDDEEDEDEEKEEEKCYCHTLKHTLLTHSNNNWTCHPLLFIGLPVTGSLKVKTLKFFFSSSPL
jgi:hypothetical protein